MCPRLNIIVAMYNGSKTPPNVVSYPTTFDILPSQNKFNFSKFLGPIGGLGLQLASSAFNHFLGNRAAQQQYDRQYQYNTPLEQRNRFAVAGFNPAAMVGGIANHNTAGNLSSVPGNNVALNGVIDSAALNNSLAAFAQLESVGANTDLMKRQIELSFIEEMIKNSEKFGLDLDNKEKQELLKWLPGEKEANIKSVLAQIDKMRAETSGIDIDNLYKPQQYEDAHRAAEDAHVISSAEGKYIDSKLNAEVLAIKAKALSDQLSAVKQTCESYKIAAESRKITNDDARAQAMHIVDVQLKQLDALVKEAEAKKLISDTQAQEWETYKDKLLTHGPGWSFSEINDFLGVIVTDFLPELIPF